MGEITEGTVMWEPTQELIEQSNLVHYMKWLKATKGIQLGDYQEVWKWSVEQLEDFWSSIWEYCDIKASQPYTKVLANKEMPGAEWFPGARLNYAEHVFRNERENKAAMVFQSEHIPFKEISWQELRVKTAAIAHSLKQFGVKPGDRVVAYMPNIPESVIAFLACASIGAIWSSCSPDFGTPSVIDRFKQIEPTVLFTVDGYHYNGKAHDKSSVINELQEALPTLKKTVIVPYVNQDVSASKWNQAVTWQDAITTNKGAELSFEQVSFDHPLWVLYSSGTTGLPKPIVQGQGGILIEHLKSFILQSDVKSDDNFFWFTTTGWMMWNFLVGGLLVGSTIILYDGSPAYPDMNVLWELAEKSGMTFFGTSAGYISACMKAGIRPGTTNDLSRLKGLGSTGSPLTTDGFSWIYEEVKEDLHLVSTSGGTDVCTSFVSGSPLLPVRAGELQCRALAAKVDSFDENGKSLIGEVGELVITEPMPSMPLFFWNDPENTRYKDSYFEMYQGVWRHGDWIKINDTGSCIIYGRSDSTINRQGVRMGTSEIYQAVEGLDEILDSLVIDLELLGRESYMPLFVVLQPGVTLDTSLKDLIKERIKKQASPRHVPNDIFEIKQIPRTLNGKKMEVPIRKILLGHPLEKSVNPDSMSNPDSLPFFIELADKLNTKA
jgi:acetoacetyl-CoA synthetase